MRALLASLFLAAAVTAGPSTAQDSVPSSGVFKSAKQIQEMCASKNTGDVVACDYYIMAAHDMIKYYGDLKLADGNVCSPKNVPSADVRAVVMEYWRGHPATLNLSAVSSIRNALFEKYPC